MKIGRITVSDRASAGIYTDLGGPEIERVLREHLGEGHEFVNVVIPDEKDLITERLRLLCRQDGCSLVVTTGGTGVTPRDVTPEATRAVLDKELPGFGEAMRLGNFEQVPTSILSRATAGIRGQCLIINLPGKPKAIGECLTLLMPAIREALAHLQGRDPHAAEPAAKTK
ncbi:MAG: molybdopterin adenylyltransferase [Nibricoccus sp.]